jgi:YD repeat-containing protein
MTGAGGNIIATATNYDARGLIAKTSLPYFDGKEQPIFSTYSYDPIGRTLGIINPDGTRRQYCYQNWITATLDENGHRTRFVEDAYGRTSDVQEYEGIYEQCQPDLNVSISDSERQAYLALFPGSEPSSTYGPYSTISFKYDALGNILEAIDAKKNKTTIDYDTLGRSVAVNDVDLGQWRYSYDANGNVIKRTDAKSQPVFFRFDALNRLIQNDYAAQKQQGEGDVVYTYDGNRAFGHGRLTQVRDNTGQGSFDYDEMGRITEEDRTLGSSSYSTKDSYDKLGRVLTLTYPDGKDVKYEYDGPFLATVKNGSGGLAFVHYEGYNSIGAPAKITYGNGVATQLSYANSQNPDCPANNYRLCKSTTTSSAGAVLQSLKFLYDGVGNITGQIDIQGSQSSFIYDAQNRLVAAGHRAIAAVPIGPIVLPSTSGMSRDSVEAAIRRFDAGGVWDIFFAYDEIGNMTYNSRRGIYDYSGPKPHAVKSISGSDGNTLYKYDANGNLEGAGDTVFE